MKKIFSLLLTVAMMISTASAVFAADYNYELTPATSEVEIGKTVKFVLKIDTNPGMLYQKNVIEFDPDVFERVDYMQSSVDPDTEEIIQIPHTVFSGLGGEYTINQDTPGKIILVWGNSTPKTGTTIARFNLKVKNDAEIVNGDYEVTVTPEQIKDSANADMSVAPAKAIVTVTGGKEPEPPVEEKKEATKAVEEKANAVVDGLYTQGFKATVTPNDQIVSEVKVVLSATKAAKTAEPIVWTAPVEGFASFEFAVNVLNVPEGETVTAAWDMTAAFAE